MFHNWGFLLSEIWGLLLLAALVGLVVGWIIWGRAPAAVVDTAAADRMRDDLAACTAKGRELAAALATAERNAAAAEARAKEAEARAIAAEARSRASADAAAAQAKSDAAAATISAAISTNTAPMAAMAPPVVMASEAAKPKGLTAARGGVPDDLKRIKGIGPALEKLCNSLGFYHFDQLANWTAAEISWVDDNLEGFKGRVTRDDWVAQAKVLAA
ncbi:MAG: hypothetical protein ACOH2M_30245 [Cypionkella sp.]